MRKRTVAPGRSKVAGPLRVAIYLRVSTAKQVKGYGLSAQEDQCLAWLDCKIGKGNYVVTKVYSDGGVSGKLASRPDCDVLNDAINDGQYDLVVFGKLDRIGRTMSDIHLWVYHTTKSGVRVATADGRIDSEDGMFGIQLSLLAYMAEAEHTLILERTMEGRERKVSDGGWPGGPVPYGLMLEGKPGEAVPAVCPAEIDVLEKGADFIVDDKDTGEGAARKLNALGMFTRSGKPWTGGNLIQKYYSTALDGYVLYRNTGRTGKKSVRLDGDGNPVYGDSVSITVPCGMAAKRVAEVRKALVRRSISKSASRDYLLSGKVFGLCGSHYVGSYRHNRDNYRYQCTGKTNAEGPKCTCKEIDASTLEAAVWDAVAERIGDHGQLQALAAEWLGAIPSRAASYRERLADLDEKVERKRKSRKTKVLGLLAVVEGEDGDDEIDLSAIEELKQTVKGQEAKLKQLRDDTLKWLQETERQEARVRAIVELASQTDPKAESFTFEQRLALLEMLGVRIEITSEVPGQVRPAGCPFEAWFEDRGLTIPDRITDEHWEKIKYLFPEPKLRGRAVDRRLVMDGALHKLRMGTLWNELPAEDYGRWQTIYNNANQWLKSGAWADAIAGLGEYKGTPLSPAYKLPSMDVTIDFDPRLSTEGR